jgi:hypothetical protein
MHVVGKGPDIHFIGPVGTVPGANQNTKDEADDDLGCKGKSFHKKSSQFTVHSHSIASAL